MHLNHRIRKLLLLYTAVLTFFSLLGTAAAAPLNGHTGVNVTSLAKRGDGYKNVVYYADWKSYSGSHSSNLPVGEITHALFAFAGMNADGTILLKDAWADLAGAIDAPDAGGVIGEMYALKKQNRNFKTVLSIGGYNDSPMFRQFALSEWGRKNCARSAVAMMTDFGMDGIDYDWEYPANSDEGWAFQELLRETREELDRYSSEQANGHRFYLSIATSAGLDKYVSLNLSALNQYLDAIHLMAYDFMGSWSNTGHHANLYRSSSNPASTVGAIHETIDDYMRRGVPADKVVLGLPLYGRAFANTDGAGASHGGEGPVDYKLLPRPSALEAVDQEAVAAYSYDPATREWVSYDNVETVAKKADYICNRGLGGAMWWEASGDRQGGGSLIDNMSNGLGYSFQWSENILSFPTSRYNNIRSGMWKMDEELAEEQNITAVAKQGVEGGEKQQVQEGVKQEAEDLWGVPPPLAYSHCIPIVWICW